MRSTVKLLNDRRDETECEEKCRGEPPVVPVSLFFCCRVLCLGAPNRGMLLDALPAVVAVEGRLHRLAHGQQLGLDLLAERWDTAKLLMEVGNMA